MKSYIFFLLSPKQLFFTKKRRKKEGKKQETFYDLNLNLQISSGVHKGRDIPCGGSFFFNHFCTVRASGWEEGVHSRSQPDSQSKRHEHHTQLHGRGIHRADRFLQRVFHPRGNSQGDRTAKEGRVTVQVNASLQKTQIIFFPVR